MASPKLLAGLAAELDDLEDRIDAGDTKSVTSLMRHRASKEYFGALRDRSFKDLRRVEDGPYSVGRYGAAHRLAAKARDHLATIEELHDLGVCSARERCEATAAEERAGMILQALIDKRAWLQDSKGHRGRQRLVSDGCVHTGRYKNDDGVRIPIVRVVR
ncbi:hypothetical protein ABIE85_007102 [Bradyrhizobium diazoefficiens]|jgi:hypothetical protein|uniref:Uncharacterized protein n=1 Tax=Bradyrhizobium diazoefficiens TaxID=1355477 RepID=A0A810BWQ0_9BRAD|nr:hypothetical protein [Bradyrhizobium diazoefficiens]MBP1060188.1 hypothetical protein [Bradyrhizobium japonicum]AWO88230.1 hypothetical protein DI395_06430 [Bradyrhizobium diazoefficiens]WLA57457.1 hypothetical protein QIH81_01540 [Bradyrhizobium diazoefficiens]BCA00288.1 hypothetical protein H12S4_11920 [Bradyrhizobium diazoefficiens]BCA17972.1 hypothetical protein BDHH15_11870 [Bradyrhizobium diazoefficiens]